MMRKMYSLSLSEIKSELASLGHAEESASIFMNLIYRSRFKKLEAYGQISSKVRNYFIESYDNALPEVIKKQVAKDGTIKLLLKLKDGESVETVVLPFYKKYTLCVSSQVGCAMNCKFCFTATQGFKRNLSASEIIGQVLKAKEIIKEIPNEKREVANIVFMGQGEPLHNFDAIKEALKILTEPSGLGLSRRNITLSTSGYLPGLKRFMELEGINFALSLHSTKDEVRSKLIPINNRYPLKDVLEEIQKIALGPKQTIEYEYLLIKDLNDSKEDAIELAETLSDRTHMINIIPFNPFPGSEFKRPDASRVEEFKNWLVRPRPALWSERSKATIFSPPVAN